MGSRRDDQAINSEQEDLVGSSSSELDDGDEDDDISDADGMHFNLCKTGSNAAALSLADTTATDWNATTTQEYQSAHQHQQQQLQHIRKCKRMLMWLILLGLGLLVTSFSLFIVLPLYQKQLEVGRKGNNAYGSILFISPVVTIVLVVIASLFGWIFKWNIQIYKFPMPVKRLLVISFCCGIAGTLCMISSYKRVPCHLQDPLKGAALVYSLIFYFFFCKRVMGLQKIFSATTAVVGLFISVDYGLCDEFRCHGNDITDASVKSQNIGWQGHAFWTLIYVTGITLWTLHLSLIEGNLVVLSATSSTPPPNNLLTTISRLVSNTDQQLEDRLIERSLPPKERSKPAHLAAWIHMIGLLVMITTGSIDVVPGTGPVKSFSQHWVDTGNTLMCHLGIEPITPDDIRPLPSIHQQSHDTLEYLSNLTPGSLRYNETVQKLRRNKRCLDCGRVKNFHRRIGHHVMQQAMYHQNHTIRTNGHHDNSKHNSTSSLLSRLVISVEDPFEHFDCQHVLSYGWLLIFTYVTFALCIFHFLDISESAVFTTSVVTASLPLVGLFWSTFRLDVQNGKAGILWSPSISGELICSLLGTPIVLLGLLLLYRAHFSDLVRPATRSLATNPYRSLQDA